MKYLVVILLFVGCADKKPVKPESWHCIPTVIDVKTRQNIEYACTDNRGEHWRMVK